MSASLTIPYGFYIIHIDPPMDTVAPLRSLSRHFITIQSRSPRIE